MVTGRRLTCLVLGLTSLAGAVQVPRGVVEAAAVEQQPMPTNGSWVRAGPMPQARANQIMVRLHDGRVLVAGGETGSDGPECKQSADIYTPGTNSWSKAAPMHRQRCQAQVAVLRDGRVLVAGGYGYVSGFQQVRRTVELYDPAANSWSWGTPMRSRRADGITETLPRGRVLVAGGHNRRSRLTSAEVYLPRAERWRRTDPMAVPRFAGSSARLQNGDVLALGGRVDRATGKRNAERYAVRRHEWRPAGRVRAAMHPVLFTLPGGHVLSISRGSVDRATLVVPSRLVSEYTPVRNTWRPVAPLPSPRAGIAVVSLKGLPLVLGGQGPRRRASTATGFRWSIRNGDWLRWTTMPEALTNVGAVRLLDGSILVAGGQHPEVSAGQHDPTKYAFRFYPGRA
ncbi:MAG: hypothetical protein WAN48_02720 [Actinomycetes bacterium]